MTPRNFTAIVNPIAGGGTAAERWRQVAALLQQAGHTVESIESHSRAHATEAAADAAEAGRIVVAVGGDGTVRDIVTGVAPCGATMAIVPSGRGNDLVSALNIPNEPDQLAQVARRGTDPIHRPDSDR